MWGWVGQIGSGVNTADDDRDTCEDDSSWSSISAQRIVSWLGAGADVCIALQLSLLHNYSSLWRSGKCSLRKKDKLSSLGWARVLDKWNKSGRNNYTSREPCSLESSLLSNSGLNVATKIRDNSCWLRESRVEMSRLYFAQVHITFTFTLNVANKIRDIVYLVIIPRGNLALLFRKFCSE